MRGGVSDLSIGQHRGSNPSWLSLIGNLGSCLRGEEPGSRHARPNEGMSMPTDFSTCRRHSSTEVLLEPEARLATSPVAREHAVIGQVPFALRSRP